MAQECELLATCGFFKKYQNSKDMACKGFLNMYCRGPKMNQCKRKEYRNQHGQAPSDDMMPSGQMIANLMTGRGDR
jgi:major membrane immunogen (membrane-anchored lipoprotein)